MDKLQALRTFVSIADQGSLTAAARQMQTSLPSVVRLLASLEDQVGVRLLNRTTRRQSLTHDGRHYLERVRRILADLDEADSALGDAVGEMNSEPAGVIRVTAPVLFGQAHVAPAINRFLKRHPKVQVRLMLHDRIVDLVDEGFDVGIRIGNLPDSTLVSQRVGHMRAVVVASPALLRRLGTPRHPDQLRDKPCVRFTGNAAALWSFSEKGRPLEVPVTGPLDVNLATPSVQACVDGLGFGQFLAYQVMPQVRARRLRIVLADHELAPIDVAVVYPSARLLAHRLKVFIDWMRKEMRTTLATQR